MTSTAPLADALSWTLEGTSLGEHEHLPFTGWIVRGALGRALRDLGCAQACGTGPCLAARRGQSCTYAELFEHGGVPLYRLDASDLDGRHLLPGDPVRLRLITFEASSGALYVEALRRALERGIGDRGVGIGVSAVRPTRLDPWARAAALGPKFLVELRTPTEIGRGTSRAEAPTPLDVLHATRSRLQALHLDVGALPPFEEEVRHHVAWTSPWQGTRWSARRSAWVPMRGARAGFKVLATPAQAVWFAVAEVLGVGTGTAFGMGVVRLVREG